MRHVVIKFCGITREADALEAARLGVNALGFNFWPESPRFLQPETARRIAQLLPPFVARVGVFVNEEPGRIREIVDQVGLSVVQLHGDETPELCSSLEPLIVFKALRMGPDFRAEEMARYPCRTFLLDGWSPQVPGGTGKTVDWPRVRGLSEYGNIILAGGLNPDNVALAIERAKPYGVDVASGIERAPGEKDQERMAEFVDAVRGVGMEKEPPHAHEREGVE